MSQLRIFSEHKPNAALLDTTDPAAIQRELAAAGVRFEQWQTQASVTAGASQEAVLAAYREPVQRLMAEEGFQTVDVISLAADHPDKDALRQKFLSEHTHSEDEVRFFVDGCGLFTLHIGERVYEALCERGDLISVPAGVAHWFDMGPAPQFVAIRFFNNTEGWVAHFTGSSIADRFNRLDRAA